ncbi:MAG: hypothetical protein AB9888_12365 [Bacteroidales bacterium]
MKNPKTIVEAIGYWLNFEYACKRSELFNERYMSYPIGQFLMARFGHLVRTEYIHPILSEIKSGKGAKPKVDFVVLRQKIKISDEEVIELAIETKWCSKSNTLVRDIVRDLVRLSLLIDKYNCSAYFILAGKKKAIDSLFADEKFAELKNVASSKPILAYGSNSIASSLKLGNPPKFRLKLLNEALIPFKDIDIPFSVPTTKFGEYPKNIRTSQYAVFGWRLDKRNVTTFKPINQPKYKFEKTLK